MVFCRSGESLSMDAGWILWDLLMYNGAQGEKWAYEAKYKSYGVGTALENMYVSRGSYQDVEHWWDGPNRKKTNAAQVNHQEVNAFGVWELDYTVNQLDERNIWNFASGYAADGISLDVIVSTAKTQHWSKGKPPVRSTGGPAVRSGHNTTKQKGHGSVVASP